MSDEQNPKLQESLLARKTPEPAAPMPAPEMPEDSGSLALAEALRSSFAILKVVMVLLAVAFLFSGFFKVGSQEKAIKLRLGKPVGEGDKALLGAGLHWALPYPLEEVVKIPFTQIQSVRSTVGWFATTPEMEASNQEPDAGNSLNPAIDSYTITSDGNIIHTRAILQFRIIDPIRCVFGFAGDTNRTFSMAGVSNAVQNALNNALVYASVHTRVDDAITRDIAGFQDKVRVRVQKLLDQQKLGVAIEQCIVVTRPPRQLKTAFNNVLQAEIKRSQVLNAARTNANSVLSKASSDAAGRINTAETERTRLVEFVSAEASRFNDLLPQFQANPELFVNQHLSETMIRALTNVQDVVYLRQRADGKPTELRLLLNREPRRMPGESEKP